MFEKCCDLFASSEESKSKLEAGVICTDYARLDSLSSESSPSLEDFLEGFLAV